MRFYGEFIPLSQQRPPPVTGASYFVVSPGVGAVRGNSVVLAPTVTTIYTLYSTNAFGRSKKTVKVTVQ